MKVVFLDIDGVLNTPGNYMDPVRGTDALENDLVKRARLVCRPADVYWVLSSTWRLAYGLAQTVAALQRHGWPEAKEKNLGETPSYPNLPRGAEIRAWLGHHPDITEYVIIDDDPNAGDGHDIDRRHVRTIGSVGLTMRNCQNAIDKLNGEAVRS